jgi:hypothetical protein
VGVYDYWAVYDWIRDRLPSGRTGNTSYVSQKLPAYMKSGICGLTSESGNSWGSQGLGFYLAAKVLWNSTTDCEAQKTEFFQRAFGPAAPAMRAYYERIDLANVPLVGPTFYRLCLDDLEQARKLAAGNTAVLERVRQITAYNAFVYLYGRANQPHAPKDELKSATFRMIQWNSRIRNSYMTFWSFFADQTISKAAVEFQEPTWNWYVMHRDGKANQIPYGTSGVAPTWAEIDPLLAEAKEHYGPVQKVTEVTFSKTLVAPDGPPMGRPLLPPYLAQGGYEIALKGGPDAPLRVTINQGTIYPKMPPGKYFVTGSDGTVVARGQAEQGRHTITVPVDKAGVYVLQYDDNAAGSAISPVDGVPTGFLLQYGKRFNIYRGNFFFYVPRGTKALEMYVVRNYPFTLYAPGRRPVGNAPGPKPGSRVIKADGSFISVPVPEGSDGQVWSSDGFNSANIHLFNIPNIAFVRENEPIVPEDVAKRDGLAF